MLVSKTKSEKNNLGRCEVYVQYLLPVHALLSFHMKALLLMGKVFM